MSAVKYMILFKLTNRKKLLIYKITNETSTRFGNFSLKKSWKLIFNITNDNYYSYNGTIYWETNLCNVILI